MQWVMKCMITIDCSVFKKTFKPTLYCKKQQVSSVLFNISAFKTFFYISISNII